MIVGTCAIVTGFLDFLNPFPQALVSNGRFLVKLLSFFTDYYSYRPTVCDLAGIIAASKTIKTIDDDNGGNIITTTTTTTTVTTTVYSRI